MTAQLAQGAASVTQPPNILIFIGDDVGVEQIPVFTIGSAPARTPNLDALASQGTRFSHVWAQPLCSPTRATLLTGRYGFRTGVGSGVGAYGDYPDSPSENGNGIREVREDYANVRAAMASYRNPERPSKDRRGIRAEEVTLPQLLRASEQSYNTAAIGKWHLADRYNGWMQNALDVGFDYSSLLMKNEPESYFSWLEATNGAFAYRKGYTPDAKVDSAKAWLSKQSSESPWLLWYAFNLPHFPHHIPPNADTDAQPEDGRAAVDAMIQQMDSAIGRVLAAVPEDQLKHTVILFIGDNGTTREGIDPPFHELKAKFTLYEGGLRVPLIMAGPGIPKNVSIDHLVNTTDLFATLLEMTGNTLPQSVTTDSISLVPYFQNDSVQSQRDFVYADTFVTDQGPESGGFAIRNQRWKLIKHRQGEELYDVSMDPYEVTNVLLDGVSAAEQAALNDLLNKANALRGS